MFFGGAPSSAVEEGPNFVFLSHAQSPSIDDQEASDVVNALASSLIADRSGAGDGVALETMAEELPLFSKDSAAISLIMQVNDCSA